MKSRIKKIGKLNTKVTISNSAVAGKSKVLKIRVRNNNDTERRANNFFIGRNLRVTL
jgi:hypothetical protein